MFHSIYNILTTIIFNSQSINNLQTLNYELIKNIYIKKMRKMLQKKDYEILTLKYIIIQDSIDTKYKNMEYLKNLYIDSIEYSQIIKDMFKDLVNDIVLLTPLKISISNELILFQK